MASSPIPFRTMLIRATASSGSESQNPDWASASRRKTSSVSWWTPLFGWSPEPDYVDPPPSSATSKSRNLDPRSARTRMAPGGFTEEKARQLRMMTLDTGSFHDAMYHSAIASRLASDFGIWFWTDL